MSVDTVAVSLRRKGYDLRFSLERGIILLDYAMLYLHISCNRQIVIQMHICLRRLFCRSLQKQRSVFAPAGPMSECRARIQSGSRRVPLKGSKTGTRPGGGMEYTRRAVLEER